MCFGRSADWGADKAAPSVDICSQLNGTKDGRPSMRSGRKGKRMKDVSKEREADDGMHLVLLTTFRLFLVMWEVIYHV
jgi:hypothetical protein